MLQAASTEAGELEFFVENRLGGDSNVFRRRENSSPAPSSAGIWEVSPRITARDRRDDLQYDFRYQPTYERFFATDASTDEGDISGLDHSAFGSVSWLATPAARVEFTGSFFLNRRIRQTFLDFPVGADPVAESSDNERSQRGRGALSVSRSVTQAVSVRASYAFDDLDYSSQQFSDSRSHSVSAGANYNVSRKTTLGLTATARIRESRANSTRVVGTTPLITEFRSVTRTTDILFSVSRRVNRHLDVSVAAGPSFITTDDERSDSNFVSGGTDQSVFAIVSGTYRWKGGSAELGYRRSEASGGGGAAASSILDDVSINIIHKPSAGWILRLGGGWNHRSSVSSDALFGLNSRVERVYANASVQKILTPRLSLIGRVQWSNQQTEQFRPASPLGPVLDQSPRTTITVGSLALRYTFEPLIY